jgi:hypothetical protein
LGDPCVWLLGRPVAFPRPIPCKGNLGLWNLPADLEGRVARARPRQRTTVVNVRHAQPGTYVYVGRRMRMGIGSEGSPWGNPFRGESWQAKYRSFILSSPDLVARLPELRGKALGWCLDSTERPADPAEYACHAQILAELADGPWAAREGSRQQTNQRGGGEESSPRLLLFVAAEFVWRWSALAECDQHVRRLRILRNGDAISNPA